MQPIEAYTDTVTDNDTVTATVTATATATVIVTDTGTDSGAIYARACVMLRKKAPPPPYTICKERVEPLFRICLFKSWQRAFSAFSMEPSRRNERSPARAD